MRLTIAAAVSSAGVDVVALIIALAVAAVHGAVSPGPAPRLVRLCTPPPRKRWLDRRLAGLVQNADLAHLVEYPLASACAVVSLCGLLGLLAGGFVAMVVGVLLSGVAIAGLVAARLGRRSIRVRAALPDVVEAVARGLRSHHSQSQSILALPDTIAEPAVLRLDLIEIKRRVDAGAAVADAMGWWVQSTGLTEVALLAAALELGSRSGGDQAGALEELAGAMRAAQGAEAEAEAMAAQGRLSARVIALAPLGVTAIVGLVDPDTVAYFATPIGVVTLFVGGVLNGAGLWWMRTIVGPS